MPRFARELGESRVISSPWNSIVPALGGTSPEMTLKSVVLPAPFGPRMARRSPYATSKSTSRTASRPPKRRPIPRRRRIGSAASAGAASVNDALARDLRDLRVADPRQASLHAAREVAARRRGLARERAAERLVDARDVTLRLDGELPALRVELLVVDRDDRLAVLVELDRAVRGAQDDLADGLLELLLAAREIALDRLQALDQAPRVDEVAERERARRLRGRGSERRDRLEPPADDPLRVVLRSRGREVARGAGAAGVRAGDAGAERLELPRGTPEQVADELLAVDRAVCLLVRLQERDQPGAADRDERAVDVRRHLLGVRRVVGRVQRREDPLRDVAADAAELGDEARRRRPREAVVVRDDRGRLPLQLVVREVAETGVPLRTVTVEAEEVRRLHLQRRVLRARRPVDERLRRMLLGVVRDGDRLVARQRADHHVGTELLHQALRLLDRGIGPVVRAADPDELQRVPADRAARPALPRVVRID